MSAADRYISQVVFSPVASGRVRPWPEPKLTATQANRAITVAVFMLAAASGAMVTDRHDEAIQAALAGPDLVRLLRAMAVIKSALALTAAGAVLWRLRAPASLARLSSYIAACAAMAAGPGLIWGMVHVTAGALFLHGGLAAAILLLWKDPATATLLAAALQRKDGGSGGDGSSPPALTYY